MHRNIHCVCSQSHCLSGIELHPIFVNKVNRKIKMSIQTFFYFTIFFLKLNNNGAFWKGLKGTIVQISVFVFWFYVQNNGMCDFLYWRKTPWHCMASHSMLYYKCAFLYFGLFWYSPSCISLLILLHIVSIILNLYIECHYFYFYSFLVLFCSYNTHTQTHSIERAKSWKKVIEDTVWLK